MTHEKRKWKQLFNISHISTVKRASNYIIRQQILRQNKETLFLYTPHPLKPVTAKRYCGGWEHKSDQLSTFSEDTMPPAIKCSTANIIYAPRTANQCWVPNSRVIFVWNSLLFNLCITSVSILCWNFASGLILIAVLYSYRLQQ